MSNFPKAEALLNHMTREAIIVWLTEYEIGKKAMSELERKLENAESFKSLKH